MTTRTTPTTWTISRLEQALLDHLKGRQDWPKQSEWYSTTPSTRLYAAMRRHGGVHSWAARLGYQYEPRSSPKGPSRPRRRKYTPESIEKQLRTMCDELGCFPTVAQIISTHGDGFYAGMRTFGGTEVWARTCGFTPRRPGRPKGATNTKNTLWTAERIDEELAVFLHGRTQWPTLPEFRAADLERLHTACLRHGGLEHWAKQYQMPAPPQRPDSKIPEHEVKQKLLTFLSGHQAASWPTIRQFRAAGEYALLKQVYLHGGHARWAKELGYPDPTGRRNRQGYDHARVYTELSLLVDTLGLQTRMPTPEEFAQHKAKRLANAIDRLGGSETWAKLLGLTARQLVAA